MKITRVLFFAFILLILFSGCPLIRSISFSPPDINLYKAAKEVAPSFSDSASTSFSSLKALSEPVATIKEINRDSPLYKLWYIMQEYIDEIHGGKIDGSNIYKFLYDAKIELDNAFIHSKSISPKKIKAPFDFAPAETYDNAANREETDGDKKMAFGTAYRLDGDVAYFLLTSKWDETQMEGGLTLSQIQGWYDQANGDLDLNMTYLVKYNSGDMSGDMYIVRSEISGNEIEHNFEIRVAVFDEIDGNVGGTSIVGAGVSQGDGNYFLLRMDPGAYNGETTDERYYVFPGDADEATIEAMDPAGYTDTANLPDTVTDYVETVSGMTLFKYEDLPHSLDDFSGSTIKLDF